MKNFILRENTIIDSIFGKVEGSITTTTFLVIGVVFLAVLILGFILDGIFDFFDFGDGILSLTTLGAFGAMFGFVGFSSKSLGTATATAILLGCIVGLLGALGAWWLSSFFKKTSSSDSVESESLIGKTGYLTLAIYDTNVPGELSVLFKGMKNSYIAYSKTPISNGDEVRIVSLRSGNSVNVEKLVVEKFEKEIEDAL